MWNNHPKIGKTTAKEGRPLQTVSELLPETFARRTWLHYYNDYLREHGVITEEEWRKMRRLIERN